MELRGLNDKQTEAVKVTRCLMEFSNGGTRSLKAERLKKL